MRLFQGLYSLLFLITWKLAPDRIPLILHEVDFSLTVNSKIYCNASPSDYPKTQEDKRLERIMQSSKVYLPFPSFSAIR